jgi:hypothetical protein
MQENGDTFGISGVVSAKIVEDHPPPPPQQVQLIHGMEENGDSLHVITTPEGDTISRRKIEDEFFSK